MDPLDTNHFFDRIRSYTQAVPDRIGPYRLHGEASRGGQGIIYRGTDTRDGALVALKNPCDADPHAEARLLRGAQLASLLDHPFVLADHRTIEHEGQLWIVTPWIEGLTLDQWSLEDRRTAEEKTRLFLRVCDAVSHAHARGVVHRDLRPANILVREEDRPCLLDFGIAKRIEFPERTAATDSGGPAGDLHYLAPELLQQDHLLSDPRQDVYSLGMLLYTMHTGVHPFAGLPIGECLDRLTAGTLFGPRIHSKLPGSLGAIVRKATSSDLATRYQSVSDLIDDVRRDLSGDTVRARSYSRRYLCRRFVRRNRPAVIAGAAAIIVGAACTALLGAAAAREQGVRAAQTNAVNMYTDLVSAAGPFGPVAPIAGPLDWLAYASSQIETAPNGASNDELLAVAQVRLTLAETYFDLRRGDLGLPHAERAYDTRKRLLGVEAPSSRQAGIVLADTLALTGRMDEAERCLIEVIGHSRFDRITDLHQMLLAAVIRSAQRRTDEAWSLFEACAAHAPEESPQLAFIREMRGTHLNRAGRPADGLSEIRQAHRIYLEHFGPDDARAIAARLFEAKSLQMLGRFDEVRDILSEIMPVTERVFGPDDPRTIQGWAHLTIADTESGNARVALERARGILDHSRRVLPQGHWNIVQAKFLVSHALLAAGEPGEVIRLWEEEAAAPEEPPNNPLKKHQPKLWIARAYNDMNMPDQALRLMAPAVDELRAILGRDHRMTVEFEFEQLRAAVQAGDPASMPQGPADFAGHCASVFGQEHPFTRRVHRYVAEQTQTSPE